MSEEINNPFIYNMIFPHAESIFTFESKNVEQIKNKCVIVLDTNVLLLPYTVSSKGLDEIKKTYEKLIGEKRLVVPGQVVREFAKNRPKKLSELYQQISDQNSKVAKLNTPTYPLLEPLEEYQNVIKLQNEINELQKKYQVEMAKVLSYIKNLNWDDHVSKLYKDLFGQTEILDPKIDQEKFLKELDQRYKNNIPPGFNDKSKEDKGIGDYLIWKTILEVGTKLKNDLIFVSGDEKNDWFHQSMKQPLYPRYELVEQYRSVSNGCSFHIINLSGLLSLYGVDRIIVEEIQTIEQEHKNIHQLNISKRRINRVVTRAIKQIALKNAKGKCQMCGGEYPFLEIHHIVPLSEGGSTSIDNLIVLCPNCHRKKDDNHND